MTVEVVKSIGNEIFYLLLAAALIYRFFIRND